MSCSVSWFVGQNLKGNCIGPSPTRGQGCGAPYHSGEQEALQVQEILGDPCLGVVHCDFRKADTISEVMKQVQECHPGSCLDIWMNNAGTVNKLA
jgi:NAD(P)-dependent dehydrogenase (short-subunit alcohol dehydrogenase family)